VADISSRDAEALAGRAAHFQELVLDVAYGPGGMIVDFPLYDSRRPLQEGEALDDLMLACAYGADWGPLAPRPTPAEMWYGENTLWVTGLFLWSQILRFRATADDDARRLARKCFLDLNHFFRLSGELEHGLLGKPHGGRAGGTWSYDQSAIPVIFYARYADELATSEEREQAVVNLRAHGDMYIRRNWTITFHGHHISNVPSGHPSSMKPLAAGYSPFELTGDTTYRDAVFPHVRHLIESGGLPWPTRRYVPNHNLYYWGLLCDYWHRTALRQEFDWIGCIREYWRVASLALGDEALALSGLYDRETGEFTPHPHGWVSADEARELQVGYPPPELLGRTWTSPTCYVMRPSETCTFAACALLARSHGLDPGADGAARRMLLRIDEDLLRYWWDDGDLPPELKPLSNVFSTETAAMWLVAYWMGRCQRVW
jgi:hypothetical protein